MPSRREYGELALITLALCTSTILSLIPSHRTHYRHRYPHTNLFLNYLSCYAAIFSILLSIVALVLGWTGAISLDALAAVVFALIPSLVNASHDRLTYFYFRHQMGKYRSLRTTHFRYVRLGRPCGQDEQASSTRPRFSGNCPGRECVASLYIRYLPHVHMAFWRLRHGPAAVKTAYKREIMKRDVQWYGIRAAHSKHCVTLLDLREGLKAWWWNSVSSATWLIGQPSLARLTRRGSVYEALALLSDIIAIGDLVLSLRREVIKTELRCDPDLQRAGRSTPIFVCNAILEVLGLDWGPVWSPSYCYPLNQPQEYGILFFVLIHKTRVFALGREVYDKIDEKNMGNRKRRRQSFGEQSDLYIGSVMRDHGTSMTSIPRISGQDIIDKLEISEFANEKEFKERQEELVDDWLISWGFDKDLLEKGSGCP